MLGEVARGGFGRVFAATDDVVGRAVAIKQPLETTAEARTRFQREARLTARLQHSGVVPVYDIGQWSDGEPFFVMKMVEGPSLAELIAECVAPEGRLALLPRVLALADTIAYAHSQGVIHRDLKPSNVIVSDYGETVVIDWGLARLGRGSLGGAEQDDLLRAPGGRDRSLAGGRVVGTPQFMAPEQADGAAADQRGDVYSIGAILYTVLAGDEPYPGLSGPDAVDRVKAGPPPPLLTRAGGVPRDLLAIVDKAMARAPDDRYPTAGDLADDLRRFLAGRLVSAQRYSLLMLLRRWLRRHRAAVIVAAVMLAALVTSSFVGVRRVLTERNAAVDAHRRLQARQNALVLSSAERSLEREPTAAAAWLKLHRTVPQPWLGRAILEEAMARGVARHVFRFEPAARRVVVSPAGPVMAVSQGTTLALHDLDTGARKELRPHRAAVTTVVFSPADGRIASADAAGVVRLWSAGGDLQREFTAGGPAGVAALDLSLDGRRLAVVSGNDAVTVGPVEAVHQGVSFRLGGRLSSLAFAPGSGVLVLTDFPGRILLLEPGAAAPRSLADGHPDARVQWLPDGRRFVTAGVDGAVWLWDAASGARRALGQHDDWVTSIAVSPDGALVATGSGDDTIRLFPVAGHPPRTLRGHGDTVRGVAFTGDGQTLVSVAFDSTVRLWHVPSGALLSEYRSLDGGATAVTVTADGRQAVTSGPDQARVWPLQAPRSRWLRGHTATINDLAWSADGRSLASASRDRTVRLWDLASGASQVSGPFEAWTMFVHFLGPRALLMNTREGHPRLIDLGSGRAVPLGIPRGPYSAPAVRGDRLAYPVGDGVVVEDLGSGRKRRLEGTFGSLADLAFTGDGQRVVVAVEDGPLGVWDADTGRLLASQAVGERIHTLAVSADGRWSLVSTAGRRLLLWDLTAAHRQPTELPTAGARVTAPRFTSDSRRIVYHAADNTLGVIDLSSRRLEVLRGHRSRVTDLSLAPGPAPLIASADASGFVRLWDLQASRSAVIHAGAGTVEEILFSPDGRSLATAGEDGGIRIWDLTSISLRGPGAAFTIATTANIDENGVLATP